MTLIISSNLPGLMLNMKSNQFSPLSLQSRMESSSKIIFLFSVFIILLFGCEKEGEYRPSTIPPPKLFILGQADPNLGVSVKVTKAVSVGKSAQFDTIFVSNARVQLVTSDGTVYGLANQGKGLFTLDTAIYRVVPGDSCFVSVTDVPYYPDCESSYVVIPQKVKSIEKIEIWKTGEYNGDIPWGEGIIKFSDELHSKDTYIFRGYGQSDNNQITELDCSISLIQLCDLYNFLGSTFLDNCVIGQDNITVSIKGQINGLNSNGFSVPADRVIVYFGTASENFHLFNYALLQPEDIEKGLAEPKPSYTNINGGLGIFYSTNLTQKVIEIQ
jgi:hypothetical protein